jgi:2-oxoisovalerate dehydrogenase E1 component
MFGDFMTLAFDQVLQQASKISSMFGIKIPIPLLIRTPMGGRRGYGPTHSQSLEKYFFGIPNILILALNQRINIEEMESKDEKDRRNCDDF